MSLTLLLDTDALLWWTHQPASLSERAREAIADGENEVFVSPVSAIEIATKNRRGRLEFESPLAHDFSGLTLLDGFKELPVSADHAQRAGAFQSPHADPWDRLLAAQAQIEGLALVTNDAQMASFGIKPYW